MSTAQKQTFIDRCYKDTSGNITLAQTPNAPILIWIVCGLIRFIHLPPHIDTGIAFIGTSAIVIWAWLELVSGANYFRRVLGFVVLLFTILPKFM
jgi:hypothetical protein